MDTKKSNSDTTGVLFVCLGNICRSPLAEGIFQHLVEEAGVSDEFEIDSAGTGSWHVGERPDTRAIAVARAHGITLPSRARQITPEDLDHFDYVIAMDLENVRNLENMAESRRTDVQIHLLREFDPEHTGDEVPDPYYGGASGFAKVFKIVSQSCEALLAGLLT